MLKLTDLFKKRPASFSFFSSWEYNQEEWYDTYILGNKKESNAQMEFGTLVGDSIGTSTSLVPALIPPGVKEYKMRAVLKDKILGDIYLIGYADHYCPEKKILNENKTTVKKDKWTQLTVDQHKQLDMYALLLYLQDKTRPEEVTMFLNYIPVLLKGVKYRLPDPPAFVQIPTKRTMLQVVEYGQYLIETLIEMQKYVDNRTKIRRV